jgi:hypothetical protein
MGELRSESRVVATSERGVLLIFEFTGTHDYTHGPKMCGYIQEHLNNAPVSGVIVDLLGYEYEFGNDVFSLFLTGHDRGGQDWLPVCILAQGGTRAALESLLREGNLGSLADMTSFASSRVEALEWLRVKGRNESA